MLHKDNMKVEDKNIDNSMIIICDECSEENKILLSKDIKCKKCEKSFVGNKYKSYIISGLTTLLIGSGIGAVADSYLNIQRPSVKTEYKMMSWCTFYYGKTEIVRDNCACAVESIAGIVDAQKARLYGESWLIDILKDKYKSCKN